MKTTKAEIDRIRRRVAAKAAADAHTNLNTWGAVIALLEGGLLYGPTRHPVDRVIAIAKREQQRYLSTFDRELLRATK